MDLNFDDVRMAVLVQRVVPAQYAFVIHTKNPSNNDEEEVFCEMVRGLGEAQRGAQVPGDEALTTSPRDEIPPAPPTLICPIHTFTPSVHTFR